MCRAIKDRFTLAALNCFADDNSHSSKALSLKLGLVKPRIAENSGLLKSTSELVRALKEETYARHRQKKKKPPASSQNSQHHLFDFDFDVSLSI